MAPALSRQTIAGAALELLDEVGLDGLTLRGVAGRLGVQAPALYWHVRNKQDLLDEMATQLWREILDELDETAELVEGAGGRPWQDQLRSFAAITRRRLLARRDGARVFAGTYLTDATLLQRQEEGLARLLATGFTLTDVIRAQSLLYSFTVGYTIEEQSVAQVSGSGDGRYDTGVRARRIGERDFPLVAAIGPEIFENTQARFEVLVAVIIDAIDRMRSG